MRRAACQPPAALAPKLFIHDHAPAEIAPRPWRAQHTTSVHAVRKLRDPHMQNNCYGGGSGGTPCQGPQALMPKKTPPYAMRPCPPMASTLSVAGHPLPANVNACPHLGRLVRLGRPGRARAPRSKPTSSRDGMSARAVSLTLFADLARDVCHASAGSCALAGRSSGAFQMEFIPYAARTSAQASPPSATRNSPGSSPVGILPRYTLRVQERA